MNILILCTGNSCRSQIAHGFMQSFDSAMQVCSAGTKSAKQVNQLAVRVMQEAGVDISSHYPKSVEMFLYEEWDYVITVCGGANESCPAFTKHMEYRLYTLEAVDTDKFILEKFRRVRNEIKHKFTEFYITQVLTK